MSYRYYNANALGKFVNDCVIRSIALVEHNTWDYTYDKLSELAQEQGTLLDDVDFVENYLDKRYPRTCHYSKTVEEFMEEFPKGTYLVTMEGHITPIIDGVLYDTFDCRNQRMWCSWRIKD